MDIRKLQRAIVDGLEDVKAQHIVVFNTEHLSALFERVIIATGASNRQTKALAASVRDCGALARHAGDAYRRRGKRRVDHRRLRRRGGAHHAAGHSRVLPPRGNLGRQAGEDEARRDAGYAAGQGFGRAAARRRGGGLGTLPGAGEDRTAKAATKKRAVARRPATPREAAKPGTVRKVVVAKPAARKSVARKAAAPRSPAAPKRRA